MRPRQTIVTLLTMMFMLFSLASYGRGQAKDSTFTSSELFGLFKDWLSMSPAVSSEDLLGSLKKYKLTQQDGSVWVLNDSKGRIGIEVHSKTYFIRFFPSVSAPAPETLISTLISKGAGFSLDNGDTFDLALPERTLSEGSHHGILHQSLVLSLAGEKLIRSTAVIKWSD